MRLIVSQAVILTLILLILQGCSSFPNADRAVSCQAFATQLRHVSTVKQRMTPADIAKVDHAIKQTRPTCAGDQHNTQAVDTATQTLRRLEVRYGLE